MEESVSRQAVGNDTLKLKNDTLNDTLILATKEVVGILCVRLDKQMGVRTKGRRKIKIENKEYVWYVELDYDSPYHILHILSMDKLLCLSCPLEAETTYLISKGRIFQNRKTDGKWNRYLLPFDKPEVITPEFVSEVIRWATKEENAIAIEWNGKEVPV